MKLIDKERIVAEIKRLLNEWHSDSSTEAKYRHEAYTELLEWVFSMPEEPVTEDLEETAKYHRGHGNYGGDINLAMEESFKVGAQWKEQLIKRQQNENKKNNISVF